MKIFYTISILLLATISVLAKQDEDRRGQTAGNLRNERSEVKTREQKKTSNSDNSSSSYSSSSSPSSSETSTTISASEEDTIVTSTTTATPTSDEDAILVIGDSWGSLSGNYLANVCGTSSTRPIQNDAKSGTTAKQWAYNRLGVQSMEKAKYAYKYVWISLGGNDFLKTNCDISLADEVAGNVVNVIKQVVDASLGVANPGEVASGVDIKILYLGYARPSKDVCGGGRTAKLFVKQSNIIFDAIRNSDYAEYVTLVDVNDMFVTAQEGSSETSQGNSLALSDPAYFEDAIHLNEAGYIKLFSGYRVQSFFGCSVLEMATMAVMKEGLPVGIIAGASIAIVSVLVLAWCCLIKKK